MPHRLPWCRTLGRCVGAALLAPLACAQGPFSEYGPFSPWTDNGPLVLGAQLGVENPWLGEVGSEGFHIGYSPGDTSVEEAAAIAEMVTPGKLETSASVFIKAAMTKNAWAPSQRELRREGLCGITALATNPALRKAMWNDLPVRAAVIHGTKLKLTPGAALDIKATVCALDAVATLGLESDNMRGMWNHTTLKKVLLDRAASSLPSVRRSALEALRNLAHDPLVSKAMWSDSWGARAVVLGGTKVTSPVEVRSAAFDTLACWAQAKHLRREMFLSATVSDAVKSAIQLANLQEQPVRASALGALANLALDCDNAAEIWGNQEMWRSWIEIAAAPHSPPANIQQGLATVVAGLRKKTPALGALAETILANHKQMAPQSPNATSATPRLLAAAASNATVWQSLVNVTSFGAQALSSLSNNPSIRREMWSSWSKDLLVYWAQVGRDYQSTKLWALYSLGNLAKNDTVRMDIWNSEVGQRVFVDIAADVQQSNQARFLSLIGLWELAGAWQTKGLIWAHQQAREAILQSTDLRGCGRIRDVSLGVTYRLATDCTVGRKFVDDSAARSKITVAATTLSGMDNILGRQFALATIYAWSEPCVGRAEQMWKDAPLKQVVLSAAFFKDDYQAMVRAFALATITNWAKSEALQPLMWQDYNGVRATLLRQANDCAPGGQTARSAAICTLQELAMLPSLKENMWQSQSLRDTLEKAAMDDTNPKAQDCAVMALARLAENEQNSMAMWLTNSTKDALMFQAGNCRLTAASVRKLSVMALQSMAAGSPEVRLPMWYEGAGYLFIRNAQRGSFVNFRTPYSVASQAWALGGLANLALDKEVALKMWQDQFGAIAAVKAAAKGTAQWQQTARTHAFAVLWHLAIQRDNRAPMWYDRSLREIVSIGAHDRECDVRAGALATWWQWSFEPQLKMQMWDDRNTRVSLLNAAGRIGAVPDIKAVLHALYSIANIAEASVLRERMWSDLGLQSALVQAIEYPHAQTQTTALMAVQHLARNSRNQPRIWQHPNLQAALLKLAAAPGGNATVQESRNFAMSILVMLANHESNKGMLASIEQVALQGCKHSESAVEAKTYSTAMLMHLTRFPENAAQIWTSPTRKLLNCLISRSELPARLDVDEVATYRNSVNTVDLVPANLRAFSDPAERERVMEAAGRLDALNALANIAAVPVSQATMWQDCVSNPGVPGACQSLLKAALNPNLKHIGFRFAGLNGISNLAGLEQNKKVMWDDLDVQKAFTGAARLRKGSRMGPAEREAWQKGTMLRGIREMGLKGLATFAQSPQLKRAMWSDADGARAALLNGARITVEVPEDNRAKEYACQALASMAGEPSLQVPMWEDSAIRTALIDAASSTDMNDREARAMAVAALQHLAMASDNQENMWKGQNKAADLSTQATLGAPIPTYPGMGAASAWAGGRRLGSPHAFLPERERGAAVPGTAADLLMRREAMQRDIDEWITAGAMLGVRS